MDIVKKIFALNKNFVKIIKIGSVFGMRHSLNLGFRDFAFFMVLAI